MGGQIATGGSDKQGSTTYQLNDQQRDLYGKASSAMFSGGGFKLPDFTTADWSSGANFVAPFDPMQQRAFGQENSTYGSQQPVMGSAQAMTRLGAGPAGTEVGPASGWSFNPNSGKMEYQDFQTGVNAYMSPYTNDVVNATTNDLIYGLQRANLASDNNSVANNSFGGSRQGVEHAINTNNFLRNLATTSANLRQQGFNAATGQFNTGWNQGLAGQQYDTGVEQANLTRLLGAGSQLGTQAGQGLALTTQDIANLYGYGQDQQQLQQAAIDAAKNWKLYQSTLPLQYATSLYQLTGPVNSSSTENTQNYVTPASAGLTALGAGIQGAATGAMMSDEDAKEGVRKADPEDSLSTIRKLKPRSFEYTDFAKAHAGAPEGRFHGFMAQDLERATGQPSPQGPGGFRHVDMIEHLGRLTHAVQALDKRTRRAA